MINSPISFCFLLIGVESLSSTDQRISEGSEVQVLSGIDV